MNSRSFLDSKVDLSPLILSSKSPPFSKTNKINVFSYSSLHHHSSYPKDDSTSSNLNKEILGSNKTPDLPSSEIILGSILGTFKACSSFELCTSSCITSKAKAAKHLKSSFKTKPKSLDSSCSSSSASSRNWILILTSLVD